MSKPFIHSTAVVEDGAVLESGVKVWHFCHVRKGAHLGELVNLGKDVFVDANVTVMRGSRVQNGVSLYQGIRINPWCFIGPHVVFTNDLFPRAGSRGWKIVPTELEPGSSLGAGSIIRCGVKVGAFSIVGAGSIVTKDIAPFTIVMGTPARPYKKVCACGQKQYALSYKMKSPFAPCCKKNITEEMLALAEQAFRKR